MSSEHLSAGKTPSPFFSLFSRKKRVNSASKSVDDLKGATAGLSIYNGHAATENGYIDADAPEPCSASQIRAWAEQPVAQTDAFMEPRSRVYLDFKNDATMAVSPSVSNSIQPDRTRYLKSSQKTRCGSRSRSEDAPPSQSNTLPNRPHDKRFTAATRREQLLSGQKKSYSADAVHLSDPSYLMEALETLADEQPLVARSIPKHAIVDTSHFAARSLDNCLFDAKVYDTMLSDSLKVCELLQNHLTDCITTVRSKSPAGHLITLAEESDEETESTTYGHSSQQTVIETRQNAAADVKRLSTLTNDTVTSSVDENFDYETPPIRTRHKVMFSEP